MPCSCGTGAIRVETFARTSSWPDFYVFGLSSHEVFSKSGSARPARPRDTRTLNQSGLVVFPRNGSQASSVSIHHLTATRTSSTLAISHRPPMVAPRIFAHSRLVSCRVGRESSLLTILTFLFSTIFPNRLHYGFSNPSRKSNRRILPCRLDFD